ncbi:GMC family oxidoreductase [Patulibacter minatonensis]|uniref:GMC family oxidoreductase n=1 Tax=Patulibacter minatonensis TaxID=298163 RepID=UPI000478D8DB|nr:GMC family oxidoreductase N-terminal domain-containing protein [Patulibacter minatonensis]
MTQGRTEHDVVIVGGGSAGCILAARLSEDPDARVLLLEAGGADTKPEIHEPTAWPLLMGSEVDWSYRTTPQQSAAGREVFFPRGKVLGGSGSINAMVYLRGTRRDNDHWAMLGNVGWDWESVLPAFKALEHHPTGDPALHGLDGPLRISLPDPPHPISEAAIEAAVELGFARNDDLNGATIEGAGYNPLTIADGRRQSAAQAFLAPAMGRENLTVVTGAHARRLLWATEDRVDGVEYERDGGLHVARAAGEVVLACGAIDTPKLLLLSGVGPADELTALGVDVRIDLSGVGRNLHDHLGAPVTFHNARPVPAGRYQFSEVGLFGKSDPALTYPDLQFAVPHIPYPPEGVTGPAEGFAIVPSVLKPQSRGSVRLATADPAVAPLIDPAYLREQADVQAVVRSIEISRELANAGPLRAWNAGEAIPGPDVSGPEALRDFGRRAAGTWFHPSGTCRMGTDGEAVVDPALRLRGTTNVRVVDASVIPTVTSANINAPTMMIAWRAADLVRSAGASRTTTAAAG